MTSEEKFERFLTQIAKRGGSASTQNQAFNAINFLYREVLRKPLGSVQALRVRTPQRVRTAPAQAEVAKIIEQVQDQHGYPIRLIVQLLYGCGLRVCEPLNLRIKDVRLSESELVIRDAKGGKDRVVAIPCSLMPALREQLKRAQLLWQQDHLDAVPVPLPGALARKYPRAAFSWQWYWLFPAHSTCADPRTGEKVRWRCHQANVQRAVKAAAVRCGLDGLVTPHVLRHAYATHAMRQGAYVRDVQVIMGHSSLETTMGYLHTEAGRVKSPLDNLSPSSPQPRQEEATAASAWSHFDFGEAADNLALPRSFERERSSTMCHRTVAPGSSFEPRSSRWSPMKEAITARHAPPHLNSRSGQRANWKASHPATLSVSLRSWPPAE